VRAALAAANGERLVRDALSDSGIVDVIRSAAAVDVVAVGKAAGPMLAGFTSAGVVRARQSIELHGSHPLPDHRSEAAARAALDIARSAGEQDLVVLLVSGGTSSLLSLPAEGISLADKRRTSELLLNAGAAIHDLNAVRKHLSAIKGGQLAAASRGSMLTLAISDVVGDDLATIGSGPTLPDETVFADALAVLERHGGARAYPRAVVARLEHGIAGDIAETPKPGDPRLSRSQGQVIGSARTVLTAARAAAESLGFAVHLFPAPVTGEARHAAWLLLDWSLRFPVHGKPVCILAAGEMTVRVEGNGKGGRNQECALAMTRGVEALGGAIVAASIGTDGIDGPTDAAGAIVDSTTISRAEAADIGPPERYLYAHNSYVFFDELGDLLRTGPTGTNVGDLQVILIGT
jgi:glycerate 2-kinase